MAKATHILLIAFYIAIIAGSILLPFLFGYSFYSESISERPFHLSYEQLKPSGIIGHGYGIVGTLLILSGIIIYILRKRLRVLSNIGRLKYWLEFHIFLCTWGTVLVLFHTTFKFGGIISVGFWALLLVWISGVIGRFIYLQIPRTIEGREISLQELLTLKTKNSEELTQKYAINFSQISTGKISQIRLKHLSKSVSDNDISILKKLIRKQRILSARIDRLEKTQQLFKAWHVIHLPFTVIMIVIMIIHVCVALFFGYKWIF